MPSFTQAASTVGLVFLASVALSGCASDPAEEDIPRKNRAQWSSALDGYVAHHDVADSYASLLLDASCMRDAGFTDWTPPWRETDPDLGPGWNPIGIRLFDQDLAATYGYRIPPATRSDTNPEWLAFSQSKNGPLPVAEQEAFTRCADSNRKKHQSVNIDAGVLNLAMGYLSLASDKARASSEVKSAEKRWLECMVPEGISDLPDTPDEMPSDSIEQKYGIPGDLEGPAAEGEIRIAVADAKCRESSGYSKAFYDIRWDESLRLYHENRDRLERARQQLDEHDKAVQEVIARYAPSKSE